MSPTENIFERFGRKMPYNAALARFNGAFLEFEYFLDLKAARLKTYANKPDANPMTVELGNYEIAKCYEFADTFMGVILETNEEIMRNAILIKEFGIEEMDRCEKLRGRELQKEIIKLKAELGL